ncbi:hypothetical protein [uncultured Jannaschia sp.]|uniref:hypothetical protein n=1 Tax=uncultured Jannaschia sp. TaxID=293347 RepID=UPI0026383C53|nr:hypothetical protein [uncultured Jannaschia sp.]
MADVARRHDLTRQHIYQWRRELRRCGRAPRKSYSCPSNMPWRGQAKLPTRGALMHGLIAGRTAPFPGQTYPRGFVTGMPRAV